MRAGNKGAGRVGVCMCLGRRSWLLFLPISWKLFPLWLHKEDVKNEINIMNQLSHVNLIQLYDAFESKNSFTLIME